ncbi:hypothetical protein [Streptomyces sp. MI02-7b]|uniref:hypothetical protein n=1 Tax=Streptomyces sp. MI02-7b TaxID=462941 RepID=UPI0029A7ADBF|nr:hypothetical protein [Streptomyces sp. MI02-7b]MDX3074576.1 hypothetical protein [Streptomyces sp. MI02-7b]
MTHEGPRITVRAETLDEGAPVAIVDTISYCELTIDFDQPPAVIASALQALFQEAVDTDRWSRRNTKPGPH